MIVEYYFIGLVIGFIFYELSGISPGGVIAPAYFSLFLFFPQRYISTLVIALIVWLIIKYAASYFILYGRRRLLLAMLLGFSIKLIIESTMSYTSPLNFDFHSIGYIIPGLIANEMQRQKVVPTLAAIGIVTLLISMVILIIR